MRAYVCGQCHVEYYFKGPEKRLTFPWAKGLRSSRSRLLRRESARRLDARRDRRPVLKAQHPEFEMWNQGIHARSGVACADCHMPYIRVGALKISDHHVRSPRAEHQQRVSDVPQVARGGAAARVSTRIQDRVFAFAESRHGLARRADRRSSRGRAAAALPRITWRSRASCSATRSSCWISSRRRTRWDSMRRRRRCASWPSRSITRGRDSWRCVAHRFPGRRRRLNLRPSKRSISYGAPRGLIAWTRH